MKIVIRPSAEKGLVKLPKKDIIYVLKKIYSITVNPLAHVERLKHSTLWKLRIMDYRAVIQISTKDQEINVISIGHRKNIYKR